MQWRRNNTDKVIKVIKFNEKIDEKIRFIYSLQVVNRKKDIGIFSVAILIYAYI